MECLECHKLLPQTKGKRAKQFCNSTCRSNYWQKAKRKLKYFTQQGEIVNNGMEIKSYEKWIDKNLPPKRNYINIDAKKNLDLGVFQKPAVDSKKAELESNTIKVPADNSEILAQIEAIKKETKPSWIDRSKFERYQEKKINELKKQLK